MRLALGAMIVAAVLWALPQAAGDIVELPFTNNGPLVAHDSLDIGEESSEDAQQCLDGLVWPLAKFSVRLEQPGAGVLDRGDVLVRFPSPVSSGNMVNDLVAMEWYVAHNENGQPKSAPAVLVVHESGSGMTVGRMIARGLQKRGLHAFMIHLPYYGERREGGKRPDNINIITALQQAIADVRRAKDAMAVLPTVEADHIALQGTSLGGFVAATVAGLDRGFESVFVMLAGGDLYGVIQNGQKDAVKVREKLEAAGLTGDKLKSLARTIEPTRLAHRIDRERFWLYSGTLDSVVPPSSAQALVTAAGLAPSHHVQMLANHYTGIVYLPVILDHITREVNGQGDERR